MCRAYDNVDDMTGATRRHFRQYRGNSIERAFDVDVDHAFPLIDLHRSHQRQWHDAGIVDLCDRR
jgi:hypothetical protein